MVDLPAGDDWSLASLDFLGDTKPREAFGPADDRQHGADATHRVRVTVGARSRVTGVEISRDWRDRIGPAGFVDALFEAYTDAVRRSLAAAAGTAYEVAHAPGDDGADDGPVEAGPAHLARLWESLRRVEAALDALPDPRTGAVRDRDREVVVTGPRGYLRAAVRDGVVVSITGDTGRITRATDGAVRTEARELLRRARGTNGSEEG